MITVYILLGLALLYFGAEWLVKGSASLGLRFGLSPVVVGAIIVAYGTSAPEMIVGVQAALKHNGDIAVGNVVGSNICNMGLVLGLSALVRPLAIRMHLIRIHVPIMILGGVILIVMMMDGRVGRAEGGILLGLFAAYTWFNLNWVRQEDDPEVLQEFKTAQPAAKTSLGRDALLVVLGLIVLIAGGESLLRGVIQLARELKIGEDLIGLTLVAAGTSFPDMAASIVAAYRKEYAIAVGNAIGSCIFNIFNCLGLAAFCMPLEAPGIQPTDLWFMLGITSLALPLMKSGRIVQRWEGAVFVLLYLGYILSRWFSWI